MSTYYSNVAVISGDVGDILVSGAGTTGVNNIYLEDGTTIGGKPAYIVPDTNLFIQWNVVAQNWQIGSGFFSRYYSNDDVATPDLATTWSPFEGFADLPVPSVTKITRTWYGDNTRDSQLRPITYRTQLQSRPIRIRPLKNTGAGTVDDYFCYYIHWQFQDNGAIDDTAITIPQFAGGSNNFELDRSDGNSENPSCDIVIVRKSDRKAVRITGNMKNTSNLTFTDVSNSAVYPELLRLYHLGYI